MAGIIRGTTPTHTFAVDADLTDAEVIYITYKQDNSIVLEKTKDDIQVSSEQLAVRLSQEETLAFNHNLFTEIQARAKYSDGTAIASNIIKVAPKRILKDGVI